MIQLIVWSFLAAFLEQTAVGMIEAERILEAGREERRQAAKEANSGSSSDA